MSDSDDEGNMVPSCKNPELSELAPCPKSPVNDEVNVKAPVSAVASMGVTEKVNGVGDDEGASHSSSSESSDSDSEDSCSESNDSESGSSSDASEHAAPTKPKHEWGLSIFFDETRRNHSPAFMAMDTNTNSSTVKEEPPRSGNPDKDGYSLDEDSNNCVLSSKYSDREIKDYSQSPMDDLFSENEPISIKSEVLSPIPSPVVSPVPPPPIPRGPRTPPSPPEEEEEEHQKDVPMHDVAPEKEETHITKSKTQPTRSSPVKNESSSNNKLRPGELSEDRHSRSKKKLTPKPRKESPSPKRRSDHHKETSASREQLVVASKDVSRPVPSAVVSRATHRSPLKPHHKLSASAKRDSSQTESNNKSLAENKSEMSGKSKTASRHSEQFEEVPVASRGNSRASSATKSSDIASSQTGSVEAEKPEFSGKHSQRSKEAHKSSSGHRSKCSVSKSTTKSRSKSDARRSATEGKKPAEKKKKSSKFSIKNFLQSPLHSDTEPQKEPSPKLPSPTKESPDLLNSPDVSPQREADEEYEEVAVEERKPAPRSANKEGKQRKSSTSTSRSRSRSGSRSSKSREVRKRSSSGNKRPGSRSSDGKKKLRDSAKTVQDTLVSTENSSLKSSKSMLLPAQPPLPELLSPIPSVKIESAIPTSLMVCIPLGKLLRVPSQHSIKNKDWLEEPPSKEVLECPSLPSIDQASTTSLPVSPSKKDFKTKHRTDSAKSVANSSSSGGGDKGSKSAKSEGISQKGVSPVPSEKSSIDSGADKCTKSSKVSEGQSSLKKRKSDKPEGEPKKKPKLSNSQMSPKSSDAVQMKLKEKTPVVKIERMDKSEIYPQPEKKTTPKRLERCDSASSLSSLCSQQSHKSLKASKDKVRDSSKDSQESKKLKTGKTSALLTAREIKKEKEEKPKVCIKKEPGVTVKTEKTKSRSKERVSAKGVTSDVKKIPSSLPSDGLNTSSQINYWENLCKIDDTKVQPTNHQRIPVVDYNSHQDAGSDWERFAPDIQQELKGLPSHLNKVNVPGPMAYYYTEGKKLKHLASKETDPIQQALKYFEATVMFILTSLHRELSNKDPDSIYQMYKDTLRFTHVIRSGIQKHQSHSMPGNIDFKILILCLKCQSLLHLKLYSLKIKEVKEQHKGVSDFMHSSSSRMGSQSSPQPTGSASHSRNLSQPSPCQPRVGGPGSVPSPHSPTPSPAGSVASVGSQSSGYSSSEVNGNNPSRPHSSLQLPHLPPHGTVTVPQNMFDVMARHHTHLSNLHMCHELWEQADMYMTRSNSKDFFREVAEKSEKLSLHSNIKDLVSYLQTGLSLLKDC